MRFLSPAGFGHLRLVTCWLILAGWCAGCHATPDQLGYCDFEQAAGTAAPPAGTTNEQVHGGQLALKVPRGQEYTAAYGGKLGGSLPYTPRHLRVSAWVYVPDGLIRSSILVVQVSRNGRGIPLWESLALNQVVTRYGQWEYVHRIIDLPHDMEPTDEIQCVIWRPETGTSFYLDDLRFDAWP